LSNTPERFWARNPSTQKYPMTIRNGAIAANRTFPMRTKTLTPASIAPPSIIAMATVGSVCTPASSCSRLSLASVDWDGLPVPTMVSSKWSSCHSLSTRRGESVATISPSLSSIARSRFRSRVP
jgi:hypothetical protein